MDEVKKPGGKPQFGEKDVLDSLSTFGFLNFSLSNIAKHLGVTTAALYRVIPSREAAVSLCLQELHDSYLKSLVIPQQCGQLELLRFLAEAMWDLYDRYEGLSTMVLTHPYSPPHVHAGSQEAG